ncbi:efflux RND transporter periplasmic adaptor subunit [Maricurvus nonylphenolicus]|uniref:efflux RND transporter periplasmic adaptor subunit n=1 Tax=Maricurvus nonylphenolicus TaxID=1008307 RepID=UPI0036F22847
MKSLFGIAGLLIGLTAGLLGYHLFLSSSDTALPKEEQPLYWVAPMDPNYRRDEPGLSPMGMELVPVYAEDNQSQEEKGTVTISPTVENNLGVRTAPVTVAPFHSQINSVGYISFDEDRLLHIHARVSGWVEKLYAKAEGETVKAGEPLYALYSPELVNAQEEFVDALRRGGKQLIRSARERLMALEIPAEHIQRLQKTRQVQRLITVSAPQTGIIESLGIREGMFIQPGNNILSIGSLEQVWVIAEIFERDAGLVSHGDKVTMRLDYLPGREWAGEVDYIYPTLDAATRTLRIRLRFDNSDRALKPNMFAQITIHHHAITASLQVPAEAVIRSGDQTRVVLSMGEGRFKSVAVAIGKVSRDYIEIISGLETNDTVVTSAQFLLDSESSITSDFQRMQAPQVSPPATDMHDHDAMMDHSNHKTMNHKTMNHETTIHKTIDHSAHSMNDNIDKEHNHD